MNKKDLIIALVMLALSFMVTIGYVLSLKLWLFGILLGVPL